jgi:uncharacterized membrane protein
MSTLTPSSDVVAQAGRAAHRLGLAALLGGNLFGRLALHPSVSRISDASERGAVVNAAWRRYGTVNSIGLLALAGGWAGERAEQARGGGGPTGARRVLVHVEDGLVATVVVTGVLTAIEGIRFARQAPEGAVPLQDGTHPGPTTPAPAARLKRTLNVLGAAAIGAEAALVAVDAVAQDDGRRTPLRRRLQRHAGRLAG